MNNHPRFCTTCNAPLDPGDDSRECAGCTDDVIDNDEPPDDSLPEFDWRSFYVRNRDRMQRSRGFLCLNIRLNLDEYPHPLL